MGASIRLIKDSTTLSHGQTGTYTGNDGRVYQTICIGTQEWLSENLMETKYRNGDAIPEVTDNTAWAALATGARCAYNNTITNVGLGNAITSSDDWVVLSETQYNTLISYVGASKAYDLIEDGYWNRTDETNLYGFNLRANGFRRNDGVFQYINGDTFIQSFNWASNSPTLKYLVVANNSNTISVVTASYATYGMGLRLIYTGAGTPTSYTGNDGKVYRVVTIGTQTWLADNLAETKYRDGSYISGYDGGVYTPISNATWAAKTTEAMCIYGDDESNMLL